MNKTGLFRHPLDDENMKILVNDKIPVNFNGKILNNYRIKDNSSKKILVNVKIPDNGNRKILTDSDFYFVDATYFLKGEQISA